MIQKLAMWMLLSALMVRADGLADNLTVTGIARFTAAYQAWDAHQFSQAAEIFRQATTNASAACTNYYWLGVAHFHRMLQLHSLPADGTNMAAADAAMEEAVVAFSQAVKLDGQHAESHALLATLYGMKINGNLLRAAQYGPRVEKHYNQALKQGPANPRVRYLLGMGQFHTAKKMAARRQALTTLLAAEQLFLGEGKHPPGAMEPRWGLGSCLTFIGQSYELLGQGSQAAEYFRRALLCQPSDHLARQGLARVTDTK